MEYLAPGVYIEEVPSGNKPIEGASTSTAGMVGVTHRGPVNIPTLVTSFGEFSRVFGGLLDHRTFTNNRDALPYAVQGFFNNGGQRVYVSRIVGPAAQFANTSIYAEPVTQAAQTTLATRAVNAGTSMVVSDATNIATGNELAIVDDVRSEYVTVNGAPVAVGAVTTAPLRTVATSGDTATIQAITEGAALVIEDDMEAGGELTLDAASIDALEVGTILRIQDTADASVTEYVTITAADDPAFDEGTLLFDHPQATTEVHIVTTAAGVDTTLSADAAAGQSTLLLTDPTGFNSDLVLSINDELYVIASVASQLTLAAGTPLTANHVAGVSVIKQTPMLQVVARYQGLWGNQVRSRIRQSHMLETTVTNAALTGDDVVVLDAIFGLNAGSYIQFSQSGAVLETLEVTEVNRATNEVTFATALTADIPQGASAQSLEYDLIVERMENGKVAEAEVFEQLGMNPAHNRYGPKVVGSFNRDTSEGSNSGESELVRLADLTFATDGVTELGAAVLANRASVLSDAVTRQLAGGTDDLANIIETTYIGQTSDDPGNRSGIFSLENEESISMVGVPGQTDVALQKALVAHCEKMRYRFAVIETPRDSSMSDAITHRQNFDTTRAAIYYPWLVVPDLFGERGDLLRIPPSGHTMGIYARTDTTRGVWKAPANEVVRSILQFETALTKGEQDILNPVHVNAFRDFRTANRGLRLWGARTLSSDPEWKYVNVRRLFLFLEQSIERGLQFAVFEPNTEALWSTVKQSISNFLITVWRNGGLEGISEDEAFFVNVGFNTTMTQTDIDNGRLIVEVGVAPVKPAEFVIIRISQKTREATA